MTFSTSISGRRAGVWLGAGVLLGIVLTLATLAGLLTIVPRWLVIKAEPVSSEAAVVLGGGHGERLRRAVGLYDANLVGELILVGGH